MVAFNGAALSDTITAGMQGAIAQNLSLTADGGMTRSLGVPNVSTAQVGQTFAAPAQNNTNTFKVI